MKKTMMAIVAMLFALASFGQTDIYMSAYFNGSLNRAVNDDYIGLHDNSKVHTFEMWVKLDTINSIGDEYLLFTPSGVMSTSGTLLGIYIHGADTSFHCVYGNNDIHANFVYDTNWHHIAFTCDTIAGADTLTLYIDGSAMCGGRFTHTLVSEFNRAGFTATQTYICADYSVNISGVVTKNAYYYGNICKLTIADSVLYNSTFIPDCVFDSIGFWSGGTISKPFRMLAPFSTDHNAYFPAYMYPSVVPDTIIPISSVVYTLGTSPCMPTYSFYCPAVCTDSETIYARQSNPSYKKGAHMSAHNNGWDGSSTSITYGAFTDSMTVYVTATHPYMDDYHNVVTVDTLVIVNAHDTTTTNGVKDVYNIGHINVYPNPSTGDFNVTTIDPVELVIYNMTGQIVYNANVTDKTMIHLSQGMYICYTTNKITNVKRSAKILIQ